MKTRYQMRLVKWLYKVDGGWMTDSNYNITKFLWSSNKRFWFWLARMPDPLVSVLFPQSLKAFANYETLRKQIEKSNLYRARMIRKLHLYAKEGRMEEFNTLMKILTKNSKAFRAWVYDATSDFKAYDLTDKQLMGAHAMFQWKVNGPIRPYRYKRVWIPKGDGKMRPLSVPYLEERWLAKLMLVWLEVWLDGQGKKVPENQFGSVKGKSTAQAWTYVFKKMIDKKFIWEFDVMKCFDSISWSAIYEITSRNNLPSGLQNYIWSVVQTAPKVNDPIISQREYMKMRLKANPRFTYVPLRVGGWKERIKMWWRTRIESLQMYEKHKMEYENLSNGRRVRKDPKARAFYERNLKKMGMFSEPKNLFDKTRISRNFHIEDIGIPQGWALSPILTNMLMEVIFKFSQTKAEWITYLDDGILAADSREDFEFERLIWGMEGVGLTIHPEKSKYVKEDGEWKSDLKFLGAVLEREGGFKGATRKGSKQALSVPKVGIISTMAKNSNGWTSKVEEYIKEYGLDEIQLAWMYSRGGFVDSAKRFIPMSLHEMTEKSLSSIRVMQWFENDREKAHEILAWVRKNNFESIERKRQGEIKRHRLWSKQQKLSLKTGPRGNLR